MIIASKGAAGVTGAGLATLAGGLQSHRPDLVDGVGLIVGIDRFMSEARALTNFAGNAVATVLIGHWTGELDRAAARPGARRRATRSTRRTMLDDHESVAPTPAPVAPVAPVAPGPPGRSRARPGLTLHSRSPGSRPRSPRAAAAAPDFCLFRVRGRMSPSARSVSWECLQVPGR